MTLETLVVNRPSNSTTFTDSVNPRCLDKDRVTLNVGGFRHETLLSTLRVLQDTRLGWLAEHALKQADYDPETEYFFDRHPGVFSSVLNYYRTGKLHCPGEVCGPLFQEELVYWGIDELQMEPCCWSKYIQHRAAQETLKAFNKDPDAQEDSTFAVDPRAPTRIQWKQRMWAMLEQPHSSKYAQILAFISMVVIILSVATFCMESMDYFDEYVSIFEALEYFYCIVFSVDLIARALSSPDKIAFIKSFMTWVDLLSVIPLYISITTTEIKSIDFLFVLRLVRILRLFRFFQTMSGMQVIGHTLRASARELFLLVLILTIPMVIFSTLVFYAEKANNPDFKSIPETFWWAMITMTTVGYGDVYPRTLLGKLVGTFCACVGVLIVALPVSVIGSNFTLFYSHAQAQLKLPQKKRKPPLLGAAGALVSETTLFNGELANIEISEAPVETRSRNTEGTIAPPMVHRNPSITPRRAAAFPRMKEALSRISCSDSQLPESSPEKVVTSSDCGKNSASAISSGLICASDVMLQIAGPSNRRMAISPMISPASRRRPHRRRQRAENRKERAVKSASELQKTERDSCCTTTDPDSPVECGKVHKLLSDESLLGGREGTVSPTACGYDEENRERKESSTENKVPMMSASGSRLNVQGVTVDCSSDLELSNLRMDHCCDDSIPHEHSRNAQKAQKERVLCESPRHADTNSYSAGTASPHASPHACSHARKTNSRGGSNGAMVDPELSGSLQRDLSKNSSKRLCEDRGSNSTAKDMYSNEGEEYFDSKAELIRSSQNKMSVLQSMSAV